MSSLAASPGNSSIYGQPKQTSDDDVLGIVNQMKDREMQDFQKKAIFMADLSNKQERMRALFDPSGPTGGQGQPVVGGGGQQGPIGQAGQQNTVMAKDPNEMTGYEKGELGVRQQGLNLESQKMAQQGKLGQESMDIKQQQEKLNQQKSDQINAQKQADMQRKSDEADQKIALAQKALEDKNNNAETALKAHQDMAAAVEERHKLEMQKLQDRFDTTSKQHQLTIDNLTEQIKQKGRSKTTVTDSTGASRTTTTEKGSAADTVKVKGKDGQMYEIPKDKLDDKDADGTPHWIQQDQPQKEE